MGRRGAAGDDATSREVRYPNAGGDYPGAGRQYLREVYRSGGHRGREQSEIRSTREFRSKGINSHLRRRQNLHAHIDHLFPASQRDTSNRRYIGVIPAMSDRDMVEGGHHVIRRIEFQPSKCG